METLQPKLRFPEFNGDWKSNYLSDVANIITGSTPSTLNDKYYNGNILFISPFDITSQRFILDSRIKITDLGLSKVRRIKKDSVLFVCIGSTIGKIGQVKVDCATNQQINTLEAKPNFFNNFIYSLLELKGDSIKLLAGNQAVPQINKSDFSKFNFYFPLLQEQTKIANFLTTIDTKINQLTQKKNLLEQYKKGVMQNIFSQELRFKDDNGNDFAEWEEKLIGQILNIGSGKDYKHLQLGDVPVYGTGGLMCYVDNYLHDGETVCIGRKGTIDKPMYFNGKIWTVDTLFYTYNFINAIPKFVFYTFQTINWKLYSEASGVPSLSKNTIEKIEICVPSIEEQIQIANFLSAIDEKINQVSKQLEQTTHYKKGLLQQMFV
jgi:type I restriction enzyme S subunit